MRSDVDIMGLYFVSIVVYMMLTIPLFVIVRRALFKSGFYRYVWHPNLFEVALYLCLVCVFVLLFPI